MEKSIERCTVTGHDLLVISDARHAGKETTKHGASVVGGIRNTRCSGRLTEALAQARRALENRLVESRLGDDIQGSQPSGHCNGVA